MLRHTRSVSHVVFSSVLSLRGDLVCNPLHRHCGDCAGQHQGRLHRLLPLRDEYHCRWVRVNDLTSKYTNTRNNDVSKTEYWDDDPFQELLEFWSNRSEMPSDLGTPCIFSSPAWLRLTQSYSSSPASRSISKVAMSVKSSKLSTFRDVKTSVYRLSSE